MLLRVSSSALVALVVRALLKVFNLLVHSRKLCGPLGLVLWLLLLLKHLAGVGDDA